MRKKSNSEKKAFAFTWAFVATLLIVLIWAFNMFYSFQSDSDKSTASPFNAVKNVFLNGGTEVYEAE